MAASLVETKITHVDTSHDDAADRDRVILDFSAEDGSTFLFCNRTTEYHHIHMTMGEASALYLTDDEVRLLRDTLTDALGE